MSKVVFSDTVVKVHLDQDCDSLAWVVRVTPTNPVHRGEDHWMYKNKCSHRGCVTFRWGAPLSPDKALAVCHIPEIHAGEGGSGKERYFSHRGTKPQSVGLCDSHVGRKRG